MVVKLNPAGLTGTKWYEYAIRFLFGGLITALTGAIAREWGPAVAGLFLAFPAIFPASVTLLEKHERQRKEQKGLHGERRAGAAAADEAMGAAMGSTGLLLFAAISWLLIPRFPLAPVLAGATCAWLLGAMSVWAIRKKKLFRRLF